LICTGFWAKVDFSTPRFKIRERKDMSSSLAAVTQGIAFSQDSIEEIRTALASAATPGWNGSLSLEVVLAPEAAQYISIVVIRRQTEKVEGHTAVRQVLPDPNRKKPVESVVEAIKSKLRIRPVLTALEVQVADGVLQKRTIQE
jgi:hypothetical protein